MHYHGTLNRTFFAFSDPTGVVDEFRLTVHPVAPGAGPSLWHGLPRPMRLKTLETRTYSDGSSTYVLAPA